MKIIKNGFTLAEVLITLGIIGVIAAMTVPALITSTADKTIGPALGKAVHDIESGLQNIIHAANEKDPSIHTLDVITYTDFFGEDKEEGSDEDKNGVYIISSDDMFTKLQGATGIVSKNSNDAAYLNSAKLYSGNDLINATYSFVKSDGLVYSFPKSNIVFAYEKSTINNETPSEDTVIARVMIDANGAEGPNRLGRDIFLFGIANNGKLVPAGSAAYNNNIKDSMNADLYTDAEKGCSGDTLPSKSNGAPCAARVAIDGWKINYKK